MNYKPFADLNFDIIGKFTEWDGSAPANTITQFFAQSNYKLWRGSEILNAINFIRSDPSFQYGFDANAITNQGVTNVSQYNLSAILVLPYLERLYLLKTGGMSSPYDSTMLYEANAIVIGNSTQYISLIDNNLNNALTSQAVWKSAINIQHTPYAVNSSKMSTPDINGNVKPDFIQINSPTSATILATTTTPIICTNSQGGSETISANQTVAIPAFDGTHIFIREDGINATCVQDISTFTSNTISNNQILTNIVGLNWTNIAIGQAISGANIPDGAVIASFVLNTSITMSLDATASSTATTKTVNFKTANEYTTLPTTGLFNGMYATTINPLQTYKRVGGAWVVSTMKKLGELPVSGGIAGTPICYALNGRFIGSLPDFASGTKQTISSNLGFPGNLCKDCLKVKVLTNPGGNFTIGNFYEPMAYYYPGFAGYAMLKSNPTRNTFQICKGANGTSVLPDNPAGGVSLVIEWFATIEWHFIIERNF